MLVIIGLKFVLQFFFFSVEIIFAPTFERKHFQGFINEFREHFVEIANDKSLIDIIQ